MAFLRSLETLEPRLRVHYLEIGSDRANRRLFVDVVGHFRIESPAVPLTVVGSRAWVGYADAASTGQEIREEALRCLAQPCRDLLAALAGDPGSPAPPHNAPRLGGGLPRAVSIPLLGQVELRELSLPALTVALAAIDGFNPCAMWTLIFLIGLLLGMKDRRRMWLLGGVFIAGSAAVYFLFMAAWLNLLLFLGLVPWIRLAVGLLAIGGGAYYLREFVRSPGGACEVTDAEPRRRIMERLRALAQDRQLLLAMGGILVLAFAVNLIELICSAGIPAVYTQVLALSPMPGWQYHGYLLLYILVFMLDDLVIFFAAMATLQMAGVTGKYARWSHLLGGATMLAIGALLILRPEWLVFG